MSASFLFYQPVSAIECEATAHDTSAFELPIVYTCAAGLEPSLVIELAHYGIEATIVDTGRVYAQCQLAQLYTSLIWTRVASRVLLPLTALEYNKSSPNPDLIETIYQHAVSYAWDSLFDLTHSFALRTDVAKSVAVNQQFALLRVKDAIADYFDQQHGSRPNVNSQDPDILIYVDINPNDTQFFLDLSGDSLHRRGYRTSPHALAPLKETLAAALLFSCQWHTDHYDSIVDPMCGSGTLIIEALQIAQKQAANINKSFGLDACTWHDAELLEQLLDHAEEVHLAQRVHPLPQVFAYDADLAAIKATQQNLIAAGFGEVVNLFDLRQRALAHLPNLTSQDTPLFISNPPYGERLGNPDSIKALYTGLGLKIQDNLPAQTYVGVLAADIEAVDTLPLSNTQTLSTYNGDIRVYFRHGTLADTTTPALITQFIKTNVELAEAQDFVNRLQKNLLKRQRQARQQGVTNLRIYDADLPDFNVVVDLYHNYVHVQEYAAPKSIPVDVAKQRFNLALRGIREVLQIDREQVYIKTRAKQAGNQQYEKSDHPPKRSKTVIVQEGQAYFYVNLTDYLDTGLFLDHRAMRLYIGQLARGKSVLNLFAYTCTASVHAALGGATSVTSVDLSHNYLDWGQRNFVLNGLVVDTGDPLRDKYHFATSTAFDWLKNNTDQFDVIFIDPPTFSNSKKFSGTFEIQRDHPALINRAMNRLTTNGVLLFSNNFQKFKLDETLSNRYAVTEITRQTIGFDFNPKRPIHRSWEIRHR